jgi:phage FluMu protein Com
LAEAPCSDHCGTKAITASPKMETIRCGKCNRKLAESEYTRIAIKCPRCGTLNHLTTAASRSPERPGASFDEVTPHETQETNAH